MSTTQYKVEFEYRIEVKESVTSFHKHLLPKNIDGFLVRFSFIPFFDSTFTLWYNHCKMKTKLSDRANHRHYHMFVIVWRLFSYDPADLGGHVDTPT